MFEEKLFEPHFTSVLAPYMLDVVEQKRALGNKYNAGVEALSAFDDFCNEQQLRIPAISKELLQKWEKKRPHENETTQCFRISYVRILCKYLHSNGYDAPCAFHPAPHVNKCFVPYIFTKDEIERLFSAVDCTKESSESPLRHLVMPVLFRLLYTCGLRVSEALHLKVADVDLDAGVLAIYGAKGDKERLVGISDSMLAYMKSYRSKTYGTDPTGIANNEDSYIMHANTDKMQNDRVLGNILLTKVDLDAARYLAAGGNGDTTLEGAVYDLYAADTIEHPDGVSGVVDYSKITDANGQPIWHTTVLTNGGWDTDYLPILQKDRLVASAKITDGKLAFANLYMGCYYLVERATGLVLPIDGNGKLYVTGKYPQLNKKLERTGKYSSLATKGGEHTDYIYKNQYSAVSESRKLDGSKVWDGYYLSYAKGYLCDEVNHYKSMTMR